MDLLFWGSAGAIFVASVLKGTVGMGFPIIVTPLIALLSDVPTAVVLSLIPNICMDLFQSFFRPWKPEDVRRILPLLLTGVVGIVVGTMLLATLSPRVLRLCLGFVVLGFVVSQLLPWKLPLPGSQLALWSAATGMVSGVIGGMTNVFGPPLVLFLYALRLDKASFVQSIGAAFLIFKLTQVAATYQWDLWTPGLATMSLPLTGVALMGFWCGRRFHARLPQATFNRAVLLVLFVAGVSLVVRAMGN